MTDNKRIIKYTVISIIPIAIVIFIIFYLKLNDPDFYIDKLPLELTENLIKNNHWNESCPIPLNRFKLINIKYYKNNKDIERDGQFIILDVIAPEALNLFKDLFKKRFIIDKINNITNYNTHYDSLIDNNSISFVCQKSEVASGFLYGYGVAFDINPLFNPSLEFTQSNDKLIINTNIKFVDYINRAQNFPQMNEKIVQIFYKHGFTEWGGNWKYNINWQYFSINPITTRILSFMDSYNGRLFFETLVKNPKIIDRFATKEFSTEIQYLYEKNPELFIKIFINNISALKNLSDSQFFDLLRQKINNK